MNPTAGYRETEEPGGCSASLIPPPGHSPRRHAPRSLQCKRHWLGLAVSLTSLTCYMGLYSGKARTVMPQSVSEIDKHPEDPKGFKGYRAKNDLHRPLKLQGCPPKPLGSFGIFGHTHIGVEGATHPTPLQGAIGNGVDRSPHVQFRSSAAHRAFRTPIIHALGATSKAPTARAYTTTSHNLQMRGCNRMSSPSVRRVSSAEELALTNHG